MNCETIEGSAADVATESLLQRIGNDPHLPMLPATALEVLEQASRPDSTMAEIGEIIRHDPALTGKILKTINSSLFGLPRSVSSIERALQLLGLKPVRSLVLSFSLPMMFRQSAMTGALATFWRTSVAGAMIARELATRLTRPDVDDDFTAALLRDVGMVILDQVSTTDYAAILAEPPDVLAEHQCDLEKQRIGVSHAEVASYILAKWRMPKEVTAAIQFHHEPTAATKSHSPAVADRALLLHFSSLAAQLLVTPSSTTLRAELAQIAYQHYQLDERKLALFLAPLNEKIEEFARALNVTIGPTPSFQRILLQATDELGRLTVQTSAEIVQVREEKREVEKQAERWRRTAYRLKRQVMHDALTGVYNRGYFEESLVTEFKRARRRSAVLGLLFLDLDGFKLLNDKFGHQFGDHTLKEVAQCLRREVRGEDIVARYGGDEFCIIVSDTNETALQGLAGRLLAALNGLVIRRAGNEGRVGASIGGVVCLPRRARHTYDEFLAAADKAMYSAKTTGKNQVTIVSLLESDDLEIMKEIERRLIANYLLASGIATEAQVREAIRSAPASAYCIGRIARRLAWIGPRKLKQVLADQRSTRRRFGEIAIERGWLTTSQVYSLLAMQRQRPDDVIDGLIEQDALNENQGRSTLKAYLKAIAAMR